MSQVLSLVLMIAALAVLFYNIRLHPHKPEELYVNIVAAREAAQAEEPAEAPETPNRRKRRKHRRCRKNLQKNKRPTPVSRGIQGV